MTDSIASAGHCPRRTKLCVLTAAAALTWILYGSFTDLGLVGWDSYPMILTSRIESAQDLWQTFTLPLMDGRYADERFYRPVANLAFALDYSLYGLDARGYHLTDLALCAGNALALFLLAWKLVPERRLLAGCVAALVYVLHPLQLEILPVAPRRADTLALLFTCCCLLTTWSNRTARRRILAFVFAACATLSKESGVLVIPLLLVLQCCDQKSVQVAGSGRSPKQRALDLAAALAGVGVAITARTLVIGGLGGYADSTITRLGRTPELVFPYLRRVFNGQPAFGVELANSLLVGALAVATGILLIALVRTEPRNRRLVTLASVWSVCLLAVCSLAGSVQEWYALLFVAPFALVLAACAASAAANFRRHNARALLIGTLPIVILGLQLSAAPLFHDYMRWHLVESQTRIQLGALSNELKTAAAGDTLRFPGFQPRLQLPRRNQKGIRSTMILRDYSIEAWAALQTPPTRIDARITRKRSRQTGELGPMVLVVDVLDPRNPDE